MLIELLLGLLLCLDTAPSQVSARVEVNLEKSSLVFARNCLVLIDGERRTIADLREGMDAVFTVQGGYITKVEVKTEGR